MGTPNWKKITVNLATKSVVNAVHPSKVVQENTYASGVSSTDFS